MAIGFLSDTDMGVQNCVLVFTIQIQDIGRNLDRVLCHNEYNMHCKNKCNFTPCLVAAGTMT